MVTRAHGLLVAIALAGAAGALVACSTILGFESVTLDEGDAAGSSDGGVTGDGALVDTGHDGSPLEASSDSPSEGGCGDTQIDKNNCGRCGHGCFGGTCTAGVCQPVQVITGFNGAYGVAVDATNVYFTVRDGNQVWRANKMDGSSPLKIADQPDAIVPHAIAVDDTYVYWTNRTSPGGEIRRCLLAGCGGSASSLIVANADYPTSLLVSGASLFWAENIGGTVKRGSRPDAGGVVTLLAADAGATPYKIALDERYVYSTDDATGVVVRTPFDGGAILRISSPGPGTYGVTVSDAGLFYLGDGVTDGIVWRVASPQGDPVDGGATPSAFASLQKSPSSVIADERNVYWTASGASDVPTGSVVYCPLAGCPSTGPIVLASSQAVPSQLAEDATQIYWSNYGLVSSATDGTIMRVAKP